MILKHETDSLSTERQGHSGTNSKLHAYADRMHGRIDENGKLTLDELGPELAGPGAEVH